MIVEVPWLMAVLISVFPAVGVIGRILGGSDGDDNTEEGVDDLLNDSFEDQLDFGGLEDDGEDAMFDEPGDQGLDEIESRVDDFEGELGNLSSTVSTVRSENEEIANVVENIEDDVRKLLEIYEMVTRGINPFIDDEVGLADGNSTNASIDLFGQEEAKEEPPDDLGNDLLEADADEFFNEDAISDDSLQSEPVANEPDTTENEPMNMDESSGGKSFDELKEEYESGDAEWANDTDPGDAPEESELHETTEDQAIPPELGTESDTESTQEEATAIPNVVEVSEHNPDRDIGGEADSSPEHPTDDTISDPKSTDISSASDAVTGISKPYLKSWPSHPVSELAVMEWLEYLVDITDGCSTRELVRYYGRIGWIEEHVVAEVETYLDGFGIDDADDADLPTGLGREGHATTLQYLLAIDGSSTTQFVGTQLDHLVAEGILGGAPPNRRHQSPAARDPIAEPGIRAEDGGAPAASEKTTLPDGGLALPLDDPPASGGRGDGN